MYNIKNVYPDTKLQIICSKRFYINIIFLKKIGPCNIELLLQKFLKYFLKLYEFLHKDTISKCMYKYLNFKTLTI